MCTFVNCCKKLGMFLWIHYAAAHFLPSFLFPAPFVSLAVRIFVWRPRKTPNGFTLPSGSSQPCCIGPFDRHLLLLFYFIKLLQTGQTWPGNRTVREDTLKKSLVERKNMKKEKQAKREQHIKHNTTATHLALNLAKRR